MRRKFLDFQYNSTAPSCAGCEAGAGAAYSPADRPGADIAHPAALVPAAAAKDFEEACSATNIAHEAQAAGGASTIAPRLLRVFHGARLGRRRRASTRSYEAAQPRCIDGYACLWGGEVSSCGVAPRAARELIAELGMIEDTTAYDTKHLTRSKHVSRVEYRYATYIQRCNV